MGLTRTRDLRTGSPVWSAFRHARVAAETLQRSTRCDVLVVGAGITGVLVAYALTQAGMRPLMVDRRRKALLGSTRASTALLQFELDTPLLHLSRSIGRRAAESVWRSSRDAVNELRTQAFQLGLRAHLCSRPSLYLAGDVLDARGLQREVAARQRAGLSGEMLDRAALRHHFGLDREAAVLTHGNAEADPVSLATGFLQHALARGARLHCPHEVSDLQVTARRILVSTHTGIEIEARHVVFCTGYELPHIVPTDGHQILSTWAMATRPQPQHMLSQRPLIWEASDPYLYMRASHDDRVICGGEDEEFADEARRDALLASKIARLQQKLGRLLPHIDTRVQYAWTGSFGSSRNGMPTIGQIPGYPHCHAVLGFGGNGITFAMLATRLITAAIRGRTHPDARLFAFE